MKTVNDFYLGQTLQYNEHSGKVNFICDEYITLCIKEYPKPALEAEHAKHPIRQVCLCVYPKYWDSLIETPTES